MRIVFVETSALLRVVFQEPGCEETLEILEGAERLVSSRLLKLEAERAVIRAAKMQKNKREAVAAALENNLNALWPKFDFFEISRAICDSAGKISPDANLRSLDAIHVATYLWLKAKVPELRFLSYDERLLELGLRQQS